MQVLNDGFQKSILWLLWHGVIRFFVTNFPILLLPSGGPLKYVPYSDALLAPSDAFSGPLKSREAACEWQKWAVNLSA